MTTVRRRSALLRRTRRVGAMAVVGALSAAGCSRGTGAGPSAWIVVTAPPDRGVDVTRATVTGASVLQATRSGGTLMLELDPMRGGSAEVVAPGACPLRIPTSDLVRGRPLQRKLAPFLDFGAPLAEAGWGAPFTVAPVPGCPEARAGTLVWRQVGGAPLTDVPTADGGFRFSARTQELEDALGAPPPWGLVALSPRTRGEAVIEATWSSGPAGSAGSTPAPAVNRRITVSAAARARGLPNVVTGTTQYLGGAGWHVVALPAGSHAAVVERAGVAALRPDVHGAFTLADASGRTLRLVAGRYDETPLDCGRSDCHADLARVAASSPMATILQRGMDAPFGPDYPACAVACHAVGDPGLDDGGFAAVAHALGRSFPDLAAGGFHDLPAPLQRVGGVGCLACHGPGAIPEPTGRHALLRADVCATCHDAPPRYGHVAGWRASRMARADADPRTREAPCARCHTTWGALGRPEWQSPHDAAAHDAAADTGVAGIACAACHAVHPAGQGAPAVGQTCAEALPREAPVPASLAQAALSHPAAQKSRLCWSCHAPAPDDASPSASAASVWAGRGGLDPVTGAELTFPAPHGDVDGGCIGCHFRGPEGLEHGGNHAFQARRSDCATCHGPGAEGTATPRAANEEPSTGVHSRDAGVRRGPAAVAAADPAIAARAAALFRALTRALRADRGAPATSLAGCAPATSLAGCAPATSLAGCAPVHAAPSRLDRSTPLGRAAWNVALVLEDPAADAHNAPYARRLLDTAARALATSGRSAAPTGDRP